MELTAKKYFDKTKSYKVLLYRGVMYYKCDYPKDCFYVLYKKIKEPIETYVYRFNSTKVGNDYFNGFYTNSLKTINRSHFGFERLFRTKGLRIKKEYSLFNY